MSGIAWIVTTDGRGELLERTIPSWEQATGNVTHRYILDDSGDHEYRSWLERTYGNEWNIVSNGIERQGYNVAMKRIRTLGLECGADHILHIEDDFLLERPVDLDAIAAVLDEQPHLAQMALLRHPWYTNEIQAGSLIEALREQGCNFDQKTNGLHNWIEHRAVWTANPNVMRADIARLPYPDGDWSESAFARYLWGKTSLSCAYWGKLSDEPYVLHIGVHRNGSGY